MTRSHHLAGSVAGVLVTAWSLIASAQSAPDAPNKEPPKQTSPPPNDQKTATPDTPEAPSATAKGDAAGTPVVSASAQTTANTDAAAATATKATVDAEAAAAEAKQAAAAANKATAETKAVQGGSLLDARCALAICPWGKAVGIEPLVELPIGKSFSASNGAVADYVNNHDIKIDLAAGVRVWMFEDLLSFAVYISKPLTDRTVRIPGSAFEYPATALRRPYPGLALGLLYDTLWLGLDHDELRNPDGTSGIARDPTYPPNALVGSSWTITVAIQPVTAFRNGIGAAKKALGSSTTGNP